MDNVFESIDSLKREIEELQKQIDQKQNKLNILMNSIFDGDKLNNMEINKYSRQIILPEIGVQGQLKLKQSSILIVGMGGLGCPIAIYLAGAGIGHIGLIDYDEIEANNIHRQIIHLEKNIGKTKVESAKNFLSSLNNNVRITTYHIQLSSENAKKIISNYNIVIDATDNVATRYLLNDSCVLENKPLVSGSALQWEGQMTVYNYNNGPCYRCLFPIPPSPETVVNCGDGGVLGPVPGVIGVLQALECIKIILDLPNISNGKLLLFDALENKFRSIKLRNKNNNCDICGENPIVKELIDYELFCSSKANDKNAHLNLLKNDQRISVFEYKALRQKPHILIDVRNNNEFEICHLKGAINIPLKDLTSTDALATIQKNMIKENDSEFPVILVCRRGNDSQKAVIKLKDVFKINKNIFFKDIEGGLHSWIKNIDSSFPYY